MKNLLPIAIIKSFTNMLFSILGRVEPYREGCGYLNNIFFYADIFGNAITGGNPRVTVSARVGYFYSKINDKPEKEKNVFLTIELFWEIFSPLFRIAASRTLLERVTLFFIEFKNLFSVPKNFWVVCRYIIDSTFAPIDGKNHCVRTYEWTKLTVLEKDGTTVNIHKGFKGFFIPLLIVIVLSCAVIWPVLRLFSKLGFISPP